MSEQPIVVCKDVTRRFGGLVANDSVTLEVRRGEILGLIGPNGAGKSTLFNLIAGAFPVSSGTIQFEGQDIAALPAARRCQLGIARTYQVPRSFDSMSVVENVTVGAFVRYPKMLDAGNLSAKYDVIIFPSGVGAALGRVTGGTEGAGAAAQPRSIPVLSSMEGERPRGQAPLSADLKRQRSRFRSAYSFSVSSGTTLKRSPTRPKSAIWKIGASSSLLMATITFESFMPARCWMAPEMPMAM